LTREVSKHFKHAFLDENVLSLGEWSIWDKVVAICIMVSEDILSPYDHPQSMVQFSEDAKRNMVKMQEKYAA